MRRIMCQQDLAYKDYVRIRQVVDNLFAGDLGQTLEDVTELYRVTCYLDRFPDVMLNLWIDKAFITLANEYITAFFEAFDLEKFKESLKGVNKYYRLDFWQLAASYQLFDHVSSERVKAFLMGNEVRAFELLNPHVLLDCHEDILKEVLISEPQCFEWFIDYYDSVEPPYGALFNQLTVEEVSDWALLYCIAFKPKLSTMYLRQLMEWRSKDGWRIESSIRELAEGVLNQLLRKQRRKEDAMRKLEDIVRWWVLGEELEGEDVE